MNLSRLLPLCPILLWATGPPTHAAGEVVRMLALGDSYTVGESVPASRRWPVQLAERLRAEDVTVTAPRIVARTGWTTDHLQQAVDSVELDPPYDLVFLLIGVNDQFRGRDVHDYRPRFRRLLEASIMLAGDRPGHVVVLSIPDYSVTPFARRRDPGRIGAAISRYNDVNRAVSRRLGVRYVDITPISKKALTNTSLLADDGLHPSGGMYRLWVDKALPVVLSIVRR